MDCGYRLWITFENGCARAITRFTKALVRGLWITYTQVIHRRLWISGGVDNLLRTNVRSDKSPATRGYSPANFLGLRISCGKPYVEFLLLQVSG